MAKKPRPRSRPIHKWPEKLRTLLLSALDTELCIPFETEQRLHAFQNLVSNFRRSARDWDHPRKDEITQLKGEIYDTIDVVMQRDGYAVNTAMFPFTLILSSNLGFGINLQAATLPTAPTSLPTYYPKDLLPREIEELDAPSEPSEDNYEELFRIPDDFGS